MIETEHILKEIDKAVRKGYEKGVNALYKHTTDDMGLKEIEKIRDY